MLACIADAIAERQVLRMLKFQYLSNLVWAVSTVKIPHPRMFERVADELCAPHRVGSFDPRCLSNIVWALAAENNSSRIVQKSGGRYGCAPSLAAFQPTGSVEHLMGVRDETTPSIV